MRLIASWPIGYGVTSSMEFSAPTPITAMSLPFVTCLQMYFIDLTEWEDSSLMCALKAFGRIGE